MEYDFRRLVGMDFGVGGCNVSNPTLLHVHMPSVCDSLPIVRYAVRCVIFVSVAVNAVHECLFIDF